MHLVRIVVWIVAGIICAVFVSWLSQTYRGRPFVRAFVEDAGPSNRLELIYVPVGFSFRGQGYDFHAVAWKTNAGGGWGMRKQISARDFQSGNPHRRWVSDIHSIDGATGTAILKIADDVYSWREWDLAKDREIRIIRVCADPFEKF